MTEARNDPEGRDPQGVNREASPGGRASRGPNADPGGDVEPGGLVPPYEGRTTARGESEISDDLTAGVERAYGDARGGGAGQTTSPPMESPVRDDEVTGDAPDSPAGVGTSPSRGGETVAKQEGKEPGREDAGTEHPSERPTGTSDTRDITGVKP